MFVGQANQLKLILILVSQIVACQKVLNNCVVSRIKYGDSIVASKPSAQVDVSAAR